MYFHYDSPPAAGRDTPPVADSDSDGGLEVAPPDMTRGGDGGSGGGGGRGGGAGPAGSAVPGHRHQREPDRRGAGTFVFQRRRERVNWRSLGTQCPTHVHTLHTRHHRSRVFRWSCLEELGEGLAHGRTELLV